MPPTRVDGRHFSADTVVLFGHLAQEGVRYLVVGGEAVILHGHIRLTGDVDLFFENEAENRRRLYEALASFWAGAIPGVTSPDDFASEGIVVQFGQPPNRIDLMNAIDGVSFEEAWRGRVEAVVAMEAGTIPVAYIGLEALVRNKRASGRPRDLVDLEYLTGRD